MLHKNESCHVRMRQSHKNESCHIRVRNVTLYMCIYIYAAKRVCVCVCVRAKCACACIRGSMYEGVENIGVATISRLLTIVGLFCRISSLS